VAALVSLAVIGFVWYVQDVGGLRSILDPQARPAAAPFGGTNPKPTIAPGGTLRIVWQSDDLAPAAHAGQVCVSADGPGQICASYTAGERPADSLTRAVRRRGYRVQTGSR
jgi:hypothetical protein